MIFSVYCLFSWLQLLIEALIYEYRGIIDHVKWVPNLDGMPLSRVEDRGDGLQIRRVVGSHGQPRMGGTPAWRLRRGTSKT
jgi:hypothetical protein